MGVDRIAKEFRDFEYDRWQKAADSYHQYWTDLTCQAIEPLLNAVQAGEGTRLLDVATGPGYVVGAALKRGSEPIGVDFSEEMLAKARSLFPTASFVCGESDDLPFDDGSFDAVTINFGMLHFGDPDRALSEVHRVLRHGGHIGFTVWASLLPILRHMESSMAPSKLMEHSMFPSPRGRHSSNTAIPKYPRMR